MIRGVTGFFAGLRALVFEPELRAVLWRMMALLVGLMLAAGLGTFWLADWLGAQFVPAGEAWYVQALAALVEVFALVLSLVVGVVAFVIFGSVAAAPWLEDLARSAGLASRGGARPWWASVAGSLATSLMPLVRFVPYALLAGLLLLLPVIGTMLAGLVWGYGGLGLLAYEFMDAPAAVRSMGWRERREEMARARWFYLGLAGAASLWMLVPVLNLLTLPAAVVAVARRWSREQETTEGPAG